jgi:hypothetical protein
MSLIGLDDIAPPVGWLFVPASPRRISSVG